MHIHALGIKSERLVVGNAHDAERLVEFPQIDVRDAQTRLVEGLGNRQRWRRGEPFRRLSRIGRGMNFGQRRQPQLGHSLFTGQHERRSAVVEGGCVGRGDRAFLVKSGAQLGNLVQTDVGVFFVAVDHRGFSPALWHRHGNNFLGEVANLPSLCGSSVALHSEGVLVFPADPFLSGAQFSAVAHVGRVVHVGQPVQQHAVLDFDVAKLGAIASLEVVGHHAHVLHASRHHHMGVTQCDGLGTQGDGLHSAGANLVHGGAWDVVPHTCTQGSLPRRRLTCTGLEHLAHEHFLHRRGVDASVFQGAFDGDGTKSGGGHRGQFALKAAHGCPDCGHDVHCV